MRKIEQTSDELLAAFWELGSASRTNQDRHLYDSPALSSAFSQYSLALNQGPGQANDALRYLIATLRVVSQSDVTARRPFTYDFFRRRFEEEAIWRKEIVTTLDKALESLR